MKVTVAPDSLKESLCAVEAARALARGLSGACNGVGVECVPMADGGEGTVDAMVAATGGRTEQVQVPDPLGRSVCARFGLWDGARRAVVEMAAASGLALLTAAERDPLRASTRGTGALVRAALDAGADRIIVGLGGSATVDGGAGMAAELGARFLGENGTVIEQPRGADLERIRRVDISGLDARLAGARIVAACDVTNPLLGPEGAARVYAPQKGADPKAVERLERGMQNYSTVLARDTGREVAGLPGAGAAGGLGAGLAALLGAELRSGVETVMEAARLRERMDGSAFALTAEGRVDGQSAFGKVPAGVARLGAELGVPVIVLGGALGPGWEKLLASNGGGAAAVLPICDGPMTREQAFERAGALLQQAAASVLRLWCAACGGAKHDG